MNATDPLTPIHLLDTVELPADQADAWLARWRSDYLPGARVRGMTCERTWTSCTGPDSVTVHVLWSLPGPYAFYGMRTAAGQDPAVAAFWTATDEIAHSRDRRALNGAGS